MALTPVDITKAKLIAAVLCRVVDYHAAAQKVAVVHKSRNGVEVSEHPAPPTPLELAEARVAVAIENVLDAGALE